MEAKITEFGTVEWFAALEQDKQMNRLFLWISTPGWAGWNQEIRKRVEASMDFEEKMDGLSVEEFERSEMLQLYRQAVKKYNESHYMKFKLMKWVIKSAAEDDLPKLSYNKMSVCIVTLANKLFMSKRGKNVSFRKSTVRQSVTHFHIFWFCLKITPYLLKISFLRGKVCYKIGGTKDDMLIYERHTNDIRNWLEYI